MSGFCYFLCLNNIPLCLYAAVSLPMHSRMDTRLISHPGYGALMDMGVQVFLSHADFVSFSYLSRSGIAGSYGRSIFSFWRNFRTVLQNGCTHLHSHQYLCLFLFFFAFCIIAIRTRNDALIVILFGIFLMANDIEHFFHIYVGHF